MKITNYEQAVKYLESFIGKIKFEITPEFIKKHDPLERMRVLLDLLGNPQDKFPSILIGGTSGKGSTAYLTSHILTTSGYKTGLTISPHLQKINERIQINGNSISDEEFTKMVGSMVQIIERMKKKSVGTPSYFEILIAMAFLYFVKEKVDIAVVEVGMGGEFDATNTLYPLVAVLTNVSLDHTSILGGTVQKIARTKAGIIKGFHQCHPEFISGSPARRQISLQQDKMLKQVQHDKEKKLIVVTGVKQPSVIKIVEDRCKDVGVELFRLGKDFSYRVKKETIDGSVFDLTTACDRMRQLNDLKLSLLGKYQAENASLAIPSVLQLGKFGFKVSEENIRKALKTAFFAGRFEVVRCYPELVSGSFSPSPVPSPLEGEGQGEGEMLKQVQHDKEKTLILDGAHNSTKMRAFLSTLKKLYPKNPKIFVVAFKSDKNIKGMLRQILRVADKIIVTEFSGKTDTSIHASVDAFNLKAQISPPRRAKRDFEGQANLKYDKKIEVLATKNSKLAMDKAFQIAKTRKDSLIIVTGSLYLVGEVKSYLTKIPNSNI